MAFLVSLPPHAYALWHFILYLRTPFEAAMHASLPRHAHNILSSGTVKLATTTTIPTYNNTREPTRTQTPTTIRM